jgi:hypothetical protein
MDESAVYLHTPEIKQQSEQWTREGQTGPVKAKVPASRTKRPSPSFLSFAGFNWQNHYPKETMINSACIRIALYILGA